MTGSVDKILSINRRDRNTDAAKFEARRNETRIRLTQEIERFVLLARDEFENYSVNPGLDIYEFDSERYLGVRLPHSPQHHFLIFLTDDGYRLIENGAQCYIDEVEEHGDTIKVLRNPSIDTRIPFYQAGDRVGSPSHGHPVGEDGSQRYAAVPLSLPLENQWHDSDVLTAGVKPMIERELSLMADDLEQMSDIIVNTQKLRAAGY